SGGRRQLDIGEADSVLRAVLPTASSNDATARVAVVVHSEKRQGFADHTHVEWEIEHVADTLRERGQLFVVAVGIDEHFLEECIDLCRVAFLARSHLGPYSLSSGRASAGLMTSPAR